MWLTNLRIWDGIADGLISQDALQIIDGKITALANTADVSGKDVRDMAGLYLIPGLIDAHVHMCLDPEIKNPLDQGKVEAKTSMDLMAERANKMLRAGITTARDLGGGKWHELKLRDQINRGELIGTRFICAGQPITCVQGHCHFWGGEADNLEQAKQVMDRQIARGVDLIKVMATGGSLTAGSTPMQAQFDAELLSEIVRLANAQDFDVAAHCHGTAGIKNATIAGVNTIEHCSWVGESGWGKDYEADIVAEMVEKNIWVSPTINAGWARFRGTKSFETMIMGNYQKMRAAGIKLIASTDAGIPGVFHHDLPKAIPVFAHFAGLSNIEALKTATSDCAEAIGLGALVGRVAPGLEADLVFYEQNPLENLAHLATPAEVLSRGKFVFEQLK